MNRKKAAAVAAVIQYLEEEWGRRANHLGGQATNGLGCKGGGLLL